MGSLSMTLRHLDINGHMGTRFPLAVTQLVGLEHLNAKECEFAKLPAGITALSRLTELQLGGNSGYDDLLDVRALGDLSRFPGLRNLTFNSCEVRLSRSVVGAARHASLASLCFYEAHPTPNCAPAVLRLGQELWRLGQGSVRKCVCSSCYSRGGLQAAQRHAPCHKFMAGWRRVGCRVLGKRLGACWVGHALVLWTHLSVTCLHTSLPAHPFIVDSAQQ